MIRFVVALAVMVVATMVTDNCASPPHAPHANSRVIVSVNLQDPHLFGTILAVLS